MTGDPYGEKGAHLRALVCLILLHERGMRQLNTDKISDRLGREPETVRESLNRCQENGLVESRLETMVEVEDRKRARQDDDRRNNNTYRRRLYWLTPAGEKYAVWAAWSAWAATGQLWSEIGEYCINLDEGHCKPDGQPGYTDDARLMLMAMTNDPDRRWHRYELAQFLRLEVTDAHFTLNRMLRMGWLKATRENVTEAEANFNTSDRTGKLLVYRLTTSGRYELREVLKNIPPLTRVRAHFFGIEIPPPDAPTIRRKEVDA